jgi:hypothetical protein
MSASCSAIAIIFQQTNYAEKLMSANFTANDFFAGCQDLLFEIK